MSNARDKANIPALNFSSTGIDDNATSTAITIDSSENVGIGTASPGTALQVEKDWVSNYGSINISHSTNSLGGLGIRCNGVFKSALIYKGGTSGALLDIGTYNAEPILFRTSNSEQMRIDSSGNVGIGTSSPDSALNISRDNFNSSIQTVPTNYSLTFANFGATGEYGNQIGLSNGTNILSSFGFVDEGAGGNTGIYFTTGSSSSQTERLRVSNNGNVGIGTSSPDDKLHVADSTSAELKLQTDNANNGSAIKFNRSGTDYSYIGTKGYFTGTSDNNLYLRANSGLGIHFYTNGNNERMRIDSSGNVGIGNSIPSDFNASANNLVIGSGTGSQGMTIYSGNTSNGNIYFADSSTGTGEYVGFIGYNHNENALRFITSTAERMRIDSSGNVGIGTTSPNVDLNVVATNGGNVEEILELRNNSTTAGTGSRIRFVNSTDAGATNNSVGISSYRNASNDIDLIFETVNSERMRIDNSGNVGINTTNTDTKFSLESPAKISRSATSILDSSNLTNKFQLLKFTIPYGFQPPRMITGTLMVSVVNSKSSFNGKFGFRSTHIDFTFCSGQGFLSNGFEVLQAINTLSNSAVNATHSAGRLTALTVTAEVSYDGGSTFGTSFGVAQSSSTPTPIVRLVANTTRSNTDADRLGLNYTGTYSYNDLSGGSSPVLSSDAITDVT